MLPFFCFFFNITCAYLKSMFGDVYVQGVILSPVCKCQNWGVATDAGED